MTSQDDAARAAFEAYARERWGLGWRGELASHVEPLASAAFHAGRASMEAERDEARGMIDDAIDAMPNDEALVTDTVVDYARNCQARAERLYIAALEAERDRLAERPLRLADRLEETQAEVERLEAERDAARDELRDWKDAAAKALAGGCADEVHCGCVPALRAAHAALQSERDALVRKSGLDPDSVPVGEAVAHACTRIGEVEAAHAAAVEALAFAETGERAKRRIAELENVALRAEVARHALERFRVAAKHVTTEYSEDEGYMIAIVPNGPDRILLTWDDFNAVRAALAEAEEEK